MGEKQEKAELIKEALKIVNSLATFDEEYIMTDENEYEKLEKLIKKAKTLKKNRLWILK